MDERPPPSPIVGEVRNMTRNVTYNITVNGAEMLDLFYALRYAEYANPLSTQYGALREKLLNQLSAHDTHNQQAKEGN